MWRLIAFLAWPVAEIVLFVVIGGKIGLLWTLAVVFGTAFLGIFMLKREAARGQVMLREAAAGGRVSMREGAPIGGLFRMLAAMFLILPGFLTDFLGLLLLLPPVQYVLSAAVMRRVTVVSAGLRQARPDMRDDVVEGEWEEVPPEEASRISAPQDAGNRRPSGWTQGPEEPKG